MHCRARDSSLANMACDAIRASIGRAVLSKRRMLALLRRNEDVAANEVR